MGLQYMVCDRCPRGGGVHRERRAAFCYRFSMVLAGSMSIVAPFLHLDAFGSSMLLAASLAATGVVSTALRAQQHMPELLLPVLRHYGRLLWLVRRGLGQHPPSTRCNLSVDEEPLLAASAHPTRALTLRDRVWQPSKRETLSPAR